MLRFLIEKEFKQIMRNPLVPKIVTILPFLMILVYPWAANMDIKNLNLSIVDNDHSSYSERLVRKASSSDYFNITDISHSNNEALRSIELNKADAILEIKDNFEVNLEKEGVGNVMISANSVNGIKGGLAVSYLTSIVSDFGNDVRNERIQLNSTRVLPIINIATQSRFNTHMDYKVYMIPAMMVMLLTLLTGFLPALNIVSEKEKGTIEQINVTPVNKFTFILSKLIPYWIIGYFVLTLCLILAAVTYNLVPVGSLITIYFFTGVYILVISGLGLVISNNSGTMQQAMFMIFFFIIILILVSGLFTPVNSMPVWAQMIATFNPLKYFIEVMRMVYLKGSNILDLKNQLFALLAFAAVLNTWAVISYRKSS